MSTSKYVNMQRIIFYVDMDAFFAAIEQRDNPKLRGKLNKVSPEFLMGGRKPIADGR